MKHRASRVVAEASSYVNVNRATQTDTRTVTRSSGSNSTEQWDHTRLMPVSCQSATANSCSSCRALTIVRPDPAA